MKLSLKFREDEHHRNPLLRAKIPISVLGLPFTSAVSAGDSSDLSFSLQTSFLSGPSLKLSYAPSTSAAAAPTAPSRAAPFFLSLKTGVGVYGSPCDSPLTITAHFSLLPASHQPTFSLLIKPQFGDFSLTKTTPSPSFPNPNPSPNPNSSSGLRFGNEESVGFVPVEKPHSALNPNSSSSADGYVPLGFLGSDTGKQNGGVFSDAGRKGGFGMERALAWRDLKMDSCCGKDGLLSGFFVRARTVLPVMKGVDMKFRWGVNFPGEFGKKMPYLTVDKIALERVEVSEEMYVKRVSEGNAGDVELLKGMCSWMGRDLEALRRENGELKKTLEELKLAVPPRKQSRERDGFVKTDVPSSVENAGSFEQWKAKKNGGEENAGSKKSVTMPSNVESELQRAIKAASS